MQSISGYALIRQIYESQKTLVYRATRSSDNLPVVIKLAADPYADERSRKFEHEFRLNALLPEEICVKTLDLGEDRGRKFLVLEDFGGMSLDHLIAADSMSLPAALRYALRLAELVGRIHERNVVHKDIKPHNFIVNPDSGVAKLTDFGIATLFSREKPSIRTPDLIEGTLAYISPEQTGRMNAEFDYRTDLYSLGVTLYELFSGKRPFEATDSMELVHSHIARMPAPPRSRGTQAPLPGPLADIVLRLLAKSAEDRYQSAQGLRNDLQKCLEQLEATGRIEPFEIATSDFSGRLRTSTRLFGREREISALKHAFARTCAGSTELVLVEGYSGIGKTSVVNVLRDEVVRRGNYFVSGKFDQYRHDIPYAAMAGAFGELLATILREPESSFRFWRQKMQDALGDLGKTMTNIVPAFESLLGPQPELPDLGPVESQNRFSHAFHSLIEAIATREHPLVIFIDDLQWIDPASLELIASLVEDRTPKALMLVGAYRSNEVDDAHPLSLRIASFRRQGVISDTLALQNLQESDSQALVMDVLGPCVDASRLGRLIHQKSQGNPFFVHRLLRNLFESGHISFDRSAGQWMWDARAVESLKAADNVVDLLTKEMRSLSNETQRVLAAGACIGSSFTESTLTAVVWISGAEFRKAASEAVDAQMLIKEDNDFRFVHDRVHQAAYELTDVVERACYHVQIGWAMYNASNVTEDSNTLFSIVDHLNRAGDMISEPSEKLLLARLNLMAGRKAQSSSAYRAALDYFSRGVALMGDEGWSADPALTFSLHEEYAQCQYVAGDFDAAEKSFDLLHRQAPTDADILRVLEARLKLYVTRVSDATTKGQRVARKALELIGLPIPEDPAAFAGLIASERDAVSNLLRQTNPEDLLRRPVADDPKLVQAMGILGQIWPMAYVTADAALNSFSVLQLVRLSVEKGHTSISPFGYGTYALMLSVEHDYRTAYEIGRLAVDLHEAIGGKDLTGRVYLNFGPNVQQYREHLRKSIPLLQASWRASQAVGDLSYAVWAMFFTTWTQFSMSQPLADVSRDAADLRPAVQRCGDENMANAFSVLEHALRLLQNEDTEHPFLTTRPGDEESLLRTWRSQHFFAAVNWLLYLKAQILYFDGSFQEAFGLLREAHKTMAAHFASYPRTQFAFLYCLTLSTLWETLPQSEREEERARFDSLLNLVGIWADACPENFLHMKELLEAEDARMSGDSAKAIHFYNKSIQSAGENGYIHNQGIAYERAGLLLNSLGSDETGQIYLREAYGRFRRWGARRKLAQMEARYPELRHRERANAADATATTASGSGMSTASTDLDVNTILKASQALSGEIVLNSLLEKMMAIVLENAGAELASLILPLEDSWSVRATKRLGSAMNPLLDSARTAESLAAAPEAVVNYVLRSHEPLVLDNASNDIRFGRDPYIVARQPKSMLCFPVQRSGAVCAVLYLENNLVPGAFTEGRLEVLRLLSSQIAISLENAELYEGLEGKVRARTADLSRTLEELQATQSQLVQSEKMAVLGKLAAGMAHELNTPIGVMQASMDTVGRGIDRVATLIDRSADLDQLKQSRSLRNTIDALREVGSSIRSSCERMAKTVNGLKSFTQLDRAELRFVDLHEGINSTLALLQHEIGPEVTVECAFGCLPQIYCNPGSLNQVFLTLMQSALEAVQQKGTITITTRCESENAIVSIRDTGSGFSQDVLDNIFEPSFSSSSGRVSARLGLSAAYDIVHKHGGALHVSSTVGEGTEFLISLPIRNEGFEETL